MEQESNSGRKRNGIARSHSQSGLLGALKCGSTGKWMSRIRIKGEIIYLGYFMCAEDAHDAYIQYAVDHDVNLSI